MNAEKIRKELRPKIKKLAKKHGFTFIWVDPLAGSNLYRMVGSDVDSFISSCEYYYIEGWDTNKFILHLKEKWSRIDNFMLVSLLSTLKPYREKFLKHERTLHRNTSRNHNVSKRVRRRSI